ncbi:MAG: SUMF1/EgtB/PvdO family nonheme iron enzyme [Pseudomonadota bacterium]
MANGFQPYFNTVPSGGIDAPALERLIGHLFDGLDAIHSAGRVHGGVSPDAVSLNTETGEVRLEDGPGVGAPSDDVQGLAGILYHAVTGKAPIAAAERKAAVEQGAPDPLADISADIGLQDRHGLAVLDAIMAGLELNPTERPASLAQWRLQFERRPRRATARPVAGTAHQSSSSVGRPMQSPAPSARGTSGMQVPFEGFAPEPERRPWGRWVAGVFLLGAIAAAGIWLVASTAGSGGVPAEGGETVAEAEEPSTPPRASADNEAWVRALELDTLEGYREYLEAFPNGRFAEEAQAEIDRYDDEAWALAEQRNTLAGYEAYLEDWTDGRHSSQARERANAIRAEREAAAADAAERAAQEATDWAEAARADTVQSYETYLSKHPAGANAAEARARRDRLAAQIADRSAFQQAEALNTVRAYEQYLSQFPSGAFQMQAIAAIDALKPVAGRTFRDCPSCPLMVTLPAGTAQLGASQSDNDASPAEGPQRPVTFSGFFAMSETEVTFAQWRACVAGGGCSAVANDNGWGRSNRPVINVTWNDASAYAAWLSQQTGERYALPSEAQWEYAARGGETGTLPGGSAAAVCAVANGAGIESGLAWANSACADPAPDRTLPAGSLIANRFGLKDMVGNVAEWTQDCNTLNLRDAPSDGSADLRGSCNQRAVRGGSWFSGPKDLRFTSRLMLRRGDSNDFTGFRVVREVSG